MFVGQIVGSKEALLWVCFNGLLFLPSFVKIGQVRELKLLHTRTRAHTQRGDVVSVVVVIFGEGA
jgi:hypothetical protein